MENDNQAFIKSLEQPKPGEKGSDPHGTSAEVLQLMLEIPTVMGQIGVLRDKVEQCLRRVAYLIGEDYDDIGKMIDERKKNK